MGFYYYIPIIFLICTNTTTEILINYISSGKNKEISAINTVEITQTSIKAG